MLNVMMSNVVILSVVIANVVAPKKGLSPEGKLELGQFISFHTELTDALNKFLEIHFAVAVFVKLPTTS
jgi:hypothetical protein